MVNTGNDLRILIVCNYLPHHDWMSFISWFSIKKYLPDAHVAIRCDRTKISNCALFGWVKKLNINFFYSRKSMEDYLEIPCDVMAVNTWFGPNIADAKSQDISTFCTYRNGCGNFVLIDWINNIVPPFEKVDSFKKVDMTVNEIKILEIWSKGLPIYLAIGES